MVNGIVWAENRGNTVQAESLFEDMLYNVIKIETLQRLSTFKTFQKLTNDNRLQFLIKEHKGNTDIYGQDKMKLKTSDGVKYFNCENCGRNISGGRFAQHINKCLERGRK